MTSREFKKANHWQIYAWRMCRYCRHFRNNGLCVANGRPFKTHTYNVCDRFDSTRMGGKDGKVRT